MVLLIDELNNLSVPVEADAAALLREMFLDRKNRLLIISTHLKDVADTINNEGASPHEAHYVTMSESSNVTQLQRMESNDGRVSCRGLTPFQAVLYGCIPSLIFSKYAGQIGADRVESYLNGKVEPSHIVAAKFVSAVVQGGVLPKSLNALEMFCSVSEGGSTRWPLIYIIDILKYLKVLGSAVQSFQQAVDAILNVSKMDSGEDWELLVKVGIFLQMIHAHYNGEQWLSKTFQAPMLSYPEVHLVDLQPQLRSLTAIGKEIESFLGRISVPIIVFFSPTLAASPQYDFFIAFKTGEKDSTPWTVGIQTKSGDKGMSKIKPVWIDRHVVVKASPVENSTGSEKGGWIYLSSNQVDEL